MVLVGASVDRLGSEQDRCLHEDRRFPSVLLPSENFVRGCQTSVNSARPVLHVVQLHGWCSTISSLMSKFTLLSRNRMRKKAFFPTKLSLVTYMERYFDCLS